MVEIFCSWVGFYVMESSWYFYPWAWIIVLFKLAHSICDVCILNVIYYNQKIGKEKKRRKSVTSWFKIVWKFYWVPSRKLHWTLYTYTGQDGWISRNPKRSVKKNNGNIAHYSVIIITSYGNSQCAMEWNLDKAHEQRWLPMHEFSEK